MLILVPWYMARNVGGGLFTTTFFGCFTAIPILMGYWTITSKISPRKNEKAKYPGLPIERYLNFRKEEDREKYSGRVRIPMETFHEMYFAGDVDFKGDALEMLEYRHDWASFRFTLGLFWFFATGMIPEMITHSRSQGET